VAPETAARSEGDFDGADTFAPGAWAALAVSAFATGTGSLAADFLAPPFAAALVIGGLVDLFAALAGAFVAGLADAFLAAARAAEVFAALALVALALSRLGGFAVLALLVAEADRPPGRAAAAMATPLGTSYSTALIRP